MSLTSGPLAAVQSPEFRNVTLVEWVNHQPLEVKANLAGRAEVRYGPPPPGRTWAIERMVVVSSSTATRPSFRWYIGEPASRNFMDGTGDGHLDVAEYPAPVIVGSGLPIVGVWTGADPDSQCWLRLQYRVLIIR